MFVPFVTQRKRLSRRRGGGKSGGAKGGGESGGSSGGGSSSAGESHSSPISTSGTSKTATSYGSGGGKAVVIPSGALFSGRSEGGGTRNQIWGTSTFGSGYPGVAGRGVVNRGFPFFFWPLSFSVGAGTGAYLHSSDEYGHADNTSRPGGVMMTAAFQSNGTNGTVFRILADNATTVDLITDIMANCSSSLNSSSVPIPAPYNDTAALPPQPEQVVQYYRASSIALSLDGYNNTADFEAEGTPDVPLPSGIDTTLLDCLNQTIGLAAPLIDGAGRTALPNSVGMVLVVLLVRLSLFFL